MKLPSLNIPPEIENDGVLNYEYALTLSFKKPEIPREE
jgi:hypothetical protein